MERAKEEVLSGIEGPRKSTRRRPGWQLTRGASGDWRPGIGLLIYSSASYADGVLWIFMLSGGNGVPFWTPRTASNACRESRIFGLLYSIVCSSFSVEFRFLSVWPCQAG